MLSEERVKHMTRIAIYEKREHRNIQPALNYSKRDYVGLQTLLHVIFGTILYGVAAAVVVAALYFTTFVNVTRFGIVVGLALGLFGYVLFLYLYLYLMRKHYIKKYDTGAEALKELRRGYHILNELYEEEERRKSPTGHTIEDER